MWPGTSPLAFCQEDLLLLTPSKNRNPWQTKAGDENTNLGQTRMGVYLGHVSNALVYKPPHTMVFIHVTCVMVCRKGKWRIHRIPPPPRSAPSPILQSACGAYWRSTLCRPPQRSSVRVLLCTTNAAVDEAISVILDRQMARLVGHLDFSTAHLHPAGEKKWLFQFYPPIMHGT